MFCRECARIYANTNVYENVKRRKSVICWKRPETIAVSVLTIIYMQTHMLFFTQWQLCPSTYHHPPLTMLWKLFKLLNVCRRLLPAADGRQMVLHKIHVNYGITAVQTKIPHTFFMHAHISRWRMIRYNQPVIGCSKQSRFFLNE